MNNKKDMEKIQEKKNYCSYCKEILIEAEDIIQGFHKVSCKDKVCSYCKKELIESIDFELKRHYYCIDEWDIHQMNKYWDLCCDNNSNVSTFKTSLEEFLLLKHRLEKLHSKLLTYRQTIRAEPNKLGLLKKFAENRDSIIPLELESVNFVIYSVDYKVFLDPFNIERLCCLLDIDILAEEVYGRENLQLIKNDIQDGKFIQNSKEKHCLINQQTVLKNRIHFIGFEIEESNVLVIANQPIDHITATLLYYYFNLYLKHFELGYEDRYKEIFFHEYHNTARNLLENNEWLVNQKNVLKKLGTM